MKEVSQPGLILGINEYYISLSGCVCVYVSAWKSWVTKGEDVLCWAPQCHSLPSKHGTGFPCLLCCLFHLSMGVFGKDLAQQGVLHKNTWIWVSLLSSNPELGDRLLYKGWGQPKKKKKNQQWLMRFPPQGCCGVFLLFAPCATSDSAAPGAALPWKQRGKPMQEMQFKWTQSTQSLPCSSFSSLQVSRLACCWCWGGPGQAWFSLHFIFFGGAESWTQGVLTNSGSESSSEQRAAFTCLRSEERTPEQCQSRVG